MRKRRGKRLKRYNLRPHRALASSEEGRAASQRPRRGRTALPRTAKQEHELVVKQGLSLDRARELVRQELFPEDLDPWAGDEQYGPLP